MAQIGESGSDTCTTVATGWALLDNVTRQHDKTA